MDRLSGLGGSFFNSVSPKGLCPETNVGLCGWASVDALGAAVWPGPLGGQSSGARVTCRSQGVSCFPWTASQSRGEVTPVPQELHDLLCLSLKCFICKMVIKIYFPESSSDCSPLSPFLPLHQDPLPSVKPPGGVLVSSLGLRADPCPR